MRLVQITDCHLHADPRARSRAGFPLRQLEAVVKAANDVRPDLVLVSGDISQDETSASYELAHGVLSRLACPWYWMAGNHDQPQLMESVRAIHQEVDLDGWRLLMVETCVPGHAHGEAGAPRLADLAERLGADDRPTLLVMHHPPVVLGSEWLDAIGLKDREALWQTLVDFPQVKIILCGHIHQALASHRQGVAIYGTPSTTDQFLPGSADFAIDEASRPGYRIVDLTDGEWLTWVERVDL